jgi:Fe-Mn family superoxide dismutase
LGELPALARKLHQGRTVDRIRKQEDAVNYKARDFSFLKGMLGFSDQLLEDHFELYEGYVKNTNEVLQKLAGGNGKANDGSIAQAELRRRLGWEWNGMRLHELYFENLGGGGFDASGGELGSRIAKEFGTEVAWRKEFESIGAMRGIGWVILYYDPIGNRLLNFWIDEHDTGHPAGCAPLVVMDVWEHAFFTDYRTDKADYIEAFLSNLDWPVAERRLNAALRLEAAAKY